MSEVSIRGISKSFGAQQVLKDIDIDIRDGEFLTLVGPSGCGKSTLIRIIAGLEHQTSGSILVDGHPVDHLRPHERRLAMVFQSYALYPHMTVHDNMAVPLAVRQLTLAERLPLVRLLSPRRPRIMREITEEVRTVARQLQIEELLARKPAQLSGGQRQRVALGRAMVRQPMAFLMDEPLSNLDAKLRVHMRTELADLHRRMGATFIYVTHDQVEAMTMSDRVAMMGGGRVQQLGTPAELYARPANLEVARFIGSPTINTILAEVGEGGAVLLQGRALGLRVALPAGSRVTLGIRPEALHFVGGDGASETGTADAPAFPATLHQTENLGSEYLCHFRPPEEGGEGLILRSATLPPLQPGATVTLGFHPAAAHLFGPDGTRIESIGENAGGGG